MLVKLPSKRCRDGKSCRFYRTNICAFNHENDENHEKGNNIKIQELEIQLKNFKRINKKLQEENDALKNDIKSSIIGPKEHTELESLKSEIINLNKENSELREEMHKVEHDVEVMKGKLLDEKKENVAKNNLLQESNEKVDKVKEDLVKEVDSHKVSRKAIDELLVKTQEADQNRHCGTEETTGEMETNEWIKDMDKLCDEILERAGNVLIDEEVDYLSDSFLDDIIREREKKDNEDDYDMMI